MNNVWLKIKVWTKIVAFAAVLIYITLFVINNSENRADLWYWFFGQGKQVNTSVLKLVAIAFLAGVLTTVLLRTSFRTIRQFRDLQDRQRADRAERELTDMKTKAAMIRTKPAAPVAGTDGMGV